MNQDGHPAENRNGSVKLTIRKKLGYTLVVLVAFVAALEVVFRLAGFHPAGYEERRGSPEDTPRGDPVAYFAVCDPILGFRNCPNGSFRYWGVEGEPLVTTDECGYRNGFGWKAEGTAPIVLFLGDSYMFAAEVDDNETGPSEVAKLLEKEFDVRVLNAGVRGFNTVQSKRMLRECFERFPSIRVVVYTFCVNDYGENMIPEMRFPAEAPVVVRDPETNRFVETDVTNPRVPWGSNFRQWCADRPEHEQAASWTDAAAGGSALFHHCRLGWRWTDVVYFRGLQLLERDQPVPVDDVLMWQAWAVHNGGREILRQLLGEMQQDCDEHQATFLVTGATYNELNIPEAPTFAEDCAKAGVRLVSLDAKFTPDARPYIAKFTNGVWEGHFNARGNRAFAEVLAPVVMSTLRQSAR